MFLLSYYHRILTSNIRYELNVEKINLYEKIY